MTGITVGYDGSHGAQRALEWAMREAAFRHALLTVLTVHPVAASGWTGNPIILPEDHPVVEEARQAAKDAIEKAAAELGEPCAVPVTVRAVSGIPAQELGQASADADLLVVGSRGHSTISRLLLGSVSTEMLHHAHCPVAVIPLDR
jgi:nucleotide-binding universal stress UspA family protein